MWRSIKNVAEVECGSAELSLSRVLASWVNSWLPGLWLWLPRDTPHAPTLSQAGAEWGNSHIPGLEGRAQEKGEEP